jgi:biofilm PGA synthesis N-glycosyltransferase PgaC
MKAIFWSSVILVIYTYAGYPAWLYFRRQWRFTPVYSAPIFPFVSVVIAAHNEAESLRRKLANLIQVKYPSERYEIVVVSDGSTDGTNRILQEHSSLKQLRVILRPRHEGKSAALNHGIEAARGEILIFTDARQTVAPDAISHLVSNFADRSVGCVSGELFLHEGDADTVSNGIGIYWSIEKKIRQWESDAGSVMGATGAIYAVRRNLVVPLPAGTILDDVYLPLHVIRQGARVIFESRAHAWDNMAPDARKEFRRKVRTLTGNYQLLRLAPWLLTGVNPVRFEFMSHKLFRLLVPFALAGAFISSLSLRGAIYGPALVTQLAFYAFAVLTIFRPKLGRLSRVADAALAFLLLNAAAAVAFIYFVTGKKKVWIR